MDEKIKNNILVMWGEQGLQEVLALNGKLCHCGRPEPYIPQLGKCFNCYYVELDCEQDARSELYPDDE